MNRIGESEYQYVNEVLNGGFRTSVNGKMCKRLETAFAEKFSSKYAVSFCNGTTTLHIALEAAGVGAGDEVIVPPLTMSSTTFAVLHAGAIPVYADIDPDTFEISAESIEKAVTPRTKAIIPVSLFGLSPDFDAINACAKKYGLIVIEDDAQCFLGKYKGKLVGTLGDIASFSFQASKHMTAGEGGIVITDNEEFAEKLRKYSGLGYASITAKKGRIQKSDIQNPFYCRHESMGWNYRMSDVCAAVALGQLERLDELCACRAKAAKRHDEILHKVSWLSPQKIGEDYRHAWWSYVVRITDERLVWKDFYNKYIEFGGPGFYAAWKLSYQEPFLQDMQLIGRERYLPGYAELKYPAQGLCPNAERIQPRLMLFKTNYWDESDLERDMVALCKTVEYFDDIINK
jgi:perosamine synthetase